jgi:hypothetical protein
MAFSCGARSAFKQHGTKLIEIHAIDPQLQGFGRHADGKDISSQI